jgi:hypothetical protein
VMAGLIDRLDTAGFSNISEAVGTAAKGAKRK